jgi:hypothetical protein
VRIDTELTTPVISEAEFRLGASRKNNQATRMKSKTVLKSVDRFGHCNPTRNDCMKARAMIRRLAWRCVRPVLRVPDAIALRRLERIDPREFAKVIKEAFKGLRNRPTNTDRSGCKSSADKDRDFLRLLSWTHFWIGLYGRTEADLAPATKVKLGEMQRLLRTMIGML